LKKFHLLVILDNFIVGTTICCRRFCKSAIVRLESDADYVGPLRPRAFDSCALALTGSTLITTETTAARSVKFLPSI